MPPDDLVVHDISGFIQKVTKIRTRWDFQDEDGGGPWFRGQQRKHWKLLPSIVREHKFDRNEEDEIREEYVLRAPALSSGEVVANDWDTYFLMQHYGAPTRLLDWTESPLIALYFAVRDNPGYYDATVWVLDPYDLNSRVIKTEEVIAPSAPGVSEKDKKKIGPWLPGRFSKREKLPNDPVAIFPMHLARRISSQKSCFTIHGAIRDGFSKFQRDKNCMARIVIPSRAVCTLKSALAQQGIDETTIFPDLEGLARALASKWLEKQRQLAHKNVYVRLKPSNLHKGGIGVFAIKPIAKGARIFAGENEEILWIPDKDVPKTGPIGMLYEDFAILKDGQYGCPTSFNRLTPAWYINESKHPNARCDENYDFIAIRDIRVGEELSTKYSEFSDPLPVRRKRPKKKPPKRRGSI